MFRPSYTHIVIFGLSVLFLIGISNVGRGLPVNLYNLRAQNCAVHDLTIDHGDQLALQTQSTKVIDSELSAYVKDIMDLWDIKGISMAIVKPDGTTELGAWGIRTEEGEPMTPDTLFCIASCSKSFLSASMGILMDDYKQGANVTPLPSPLPKFNFRTKVKDILPDDWEIQDKYANSAANLRDILSHVSGLPRHDLSYGPGDSARDIVRRLRNLKPSFELREQWSYNNQMYITGSYIISKYADMPYTKFVADRIFRPLGMNSSTFSPTEAINSGKLTQTWLLGGRRIPYWIPEELAETNAGAGGVITNVIDLTRYLRMLVNSGVDPVTNQTVIPKGAFNSITTSSAIMVGRGTSDTSIQGYGMGWMRSAFRGAEVISHTGGIPGFSTFLAFLPHNKLGIAILVNTDNAATAFTQIAYRVAENALSLSKTRREIGPPSPVLYPEHPKGANTTLPLSAYTGTYTGDGYGAITICDPASTSNYCNRVLSRFDAVDSVQSPASSNDTLQLFAEWPRTWGSHVRFTHFQNDSFVFTVTTLFVDGYGMNKTAFEAFEPYFYPGTAKFDVRDGRVVGFGLWDTQPELMGWEAAYFTRVV